MIYQIIESLSNPLWFLSPLACMAISASGAASSSSRYAITISFAIVNVLPPGFLRLVLLRHSLQGDCRSTRIRQKRESISGVALDHSKAVAGKCFAPNSMTLIELVNRFERSRYSAHLVALQPHPILKQIGRPRIQFVHLLLGVGPLLDNV